MRGFLLYVIGYLYKMNFFETIYNLLIESVEDVDAIFEKYYSDKLDRNRFNIIAKADEATKVNKEGKIEKLGKYARLLMSLYINSKLQIEDLSLAQEYIYLIYKHNIKGIDWTNIKELGDLHPFVEKYMAQNTQTIDEILPYLDEGDDYKLLHNGEEYIIYQPLTEKGACYLGVGATWCTTWGPLSLDPKNRDKSNRFKQYNSNGPLYIIVPKDNFDGRVQINFEGDEYKNKNNSSIYVKDFLDNQELFNFFFPLNDQTTKEQMEVMIGRLKFLSSEKQAIVRKFKKELLGGVIYGDELALIDADDDFSGDEWIAKHTNIDTLESVEIDDDRVQFNFNSIKGFVHITNLETYVNNLIRYKENEHPTDVHEPDHDDMYYMFMHVFENERDLPIEWLGNSIESNDFEKFWAKYGDGLYDHLRSQYYDKFNDLNYQNIDHAYNRLIENVTKYIDVEFGGGYSSKNTIYFNIDKFNDYVTTKGINTIDNFDDFVDDYLNWFDINTEDYDIWEYLEWDYPRYHDLKDEIDDFFNNEDRKSEREFVEVLHKQLKDFDNLSRSWVWEDGDKKVEIKKTGYSVENGTVEMVYTNKKTGEVHNGQVRVENIHKYVTMNMLAEIYFKFKKNILL